MDNSSPFDSERCVCFDFFLCLILKLSKKLKKKPCEGHSKQQQSAHLSGLGELFFQLNSHPTDEKTSESVLVVFVVKSSDAL